MPQPFRSGLPLAVAFVATLALLPARADAQVVRGGVYVSAGGMWGYPYYPWFGAGWGPYAPYGPYGFWRPYGPYGYPYYGYPDLVTASLRLAVDARQAEVYVDGYAAGVIDDFDGVFQRLRLRPGEHDLAIYQPGHRTVRQSLYLGPGSDQKLQFRLEPLGPGETEEPRPTPDPERARGRREGPDRGDQPGQVDAPAGQSYYRRPVEQEAPVRVQVPERRASVGTVTIRVQPGDAEILVDGERWSAPAGQDRISIQLDEGRHRIEIRKDGFVRYTEDVLIRRNATLALNVSLVR